MNPTYKRSNLDTTFKLHPTLFKLNLNMVQSVTPQLYEFNQNPSRFLSYIYSLHCTYHKVKLRRFFSHTIHKKLYVKIKMIRLKTIFVPQVYMEIMFTPEKFWSMHILPFKMLIISGGNYNPSYILPRSDMIVNVYFRGS